MAEIFDRVKGGINKGVALVGVNSKALVEKAKINNAVKNLNDEKRQLAELLGVKVYENYMAGKETANEDIASIAEKMTNCVQLITGQEEKLKQLEEEVSIAAGRKAYSPECKCGIVNPPGAKFCSGCGSQL